MTTTRRHWLHTLAACALLPLQAQARSTPFKITMVLPHEPQSTERGFQSYLEKSGLLVAFSIVRNTTGLPSEQLRAQVRATAPDLIYAWGTPTTLALAGPHDAPHRTHSLADIPIVFTEVTDPVASKLLPALQDTRRNVTGVSHVAPLPVQINAMQAYRRFRRIGYLHNPAEPNSAIILEKLKALGPKHGFDVIEAPLPLDAAGKPNAQDIAPKVAELAIQKVDLLYVGPITFLAFTERDAVTQAALHHKLPTFCTTESIVRQSACLFGLFSNDANVGRYAGAMAKDILSQNKRVQEIPASTLERFSLLVNMQTAQALDLYPPMLLLNVAEVINVPQHSLRTP